MKKTYAIGTHLKIVGDNMNYIVIDGERVETKKIIYGGEKCSIWDLAEIKKRNTGEHWSYDRFLQLLQSPLYSIRECVEMTKQELYELRAERHRNKLCKCGSAMSHVKDERKFMSKHWWVIESKYKCKCENTTTTKNYERRTCPLCKELITKDCGHNDYKK